MPQRILVIKHGALGDLIQAMDAFAAIRRHHRGAELVLMTAPAHAALTSAMPWFDRLWLDTRPSIVRPLAWWRIRARFLAEGFARIYDLQCSARTARYWRMLPARRRPEWVGAVGSHRNPDFSSGAWSNRAKMAAQLAVVGIGAPAPAELDWLAGDVTAFRLPARYALLVPGCSPHLPQKRWPAERYGWLARRLASEGYDSVMVGTGADRDALAGVRRVAPEVLDLGGRTTLAQLASVARHAAVAVGNDTGATFLASALGTPTLMLMSRHTDPVVSAPWGAGAAWLKRADLAALEVAEVAAALPRPRPGRSPKEERTTLR